MRPRSKPITCYSNDLQQWSDLQQWLQSSHASSLIAQQTQLLKGALAALPMHSGLLMGLEPGLLDVCPLKHQWALSPQHSQTTEGIISPTSHWPIRSHVVDMVLLHHALDFHEQPKSLMSEAVRVLGEGGYLVILGFNPYSALGVFHRFSTGADCCLRKARFIAPNRLHHWLVLHQCQLLTTYYQVPTSSHWLHKIEQCHHKLWHKSGEYYLMIAQKSAVPVMPLPNRGPLQSFFPGKKLIEYPFSKKKRTKNPIL